MLAIHSINYGSAITRDRCAIIGHETIIAGQNIAIIRHSLVKETKRKEGENKDIMIKRRRGKDYTQRVKASSDI